GRRPARRPGAAGRSPPACCRSLMKNAASFLAIGFLVLVLIVFLAAPQIFAPIFRPLVQANAPAIYTQANLLSLTLSHLTTVAIATGLATLVAGALAVLVTRPFGADFLPLSRSIVNIGQTFPPVAVLALAVPMIGFGEK